MCCGRCCGASFDGCARSAEKRSEKAREIKLKAETAEKEREVHEAELAALEKRKEMIKIMVDCKSDIENAKTKSEVRKAKKK